MQHGLLFLWPFLSLLQVCNVGGASPVLNGAVGGSIVLPAGVDGTVKVVLMQWRKNNTPIIQSTKTGVEVLSPALKGRATMSNETWDLTISSLREEDSGKYIFSVAGSSFKPKVVKLYVYERISKVQVDSQVKNSTNSSSCSVTLSCSVLGGSQVALSWSRDGQRISEAENRTTLTVSPSREELYSCTASNPVSSLTGRVTIPPCQTHAIAPPPGLSVCELKAVLFSVGLVAMVSAVIAVNVRSVLQENQNQTRTRTRSRAEWKSQDSPTEEEEEGL